MSETTGYNGVVHRLRELLELIGVPAEHCLPERLVERIEVAKEDVRHDRAALDRARVAEQRIEAGRECWLDREGNVWNAIEQGVDANANILAREKYGPFTRGRFVADQEGT